MKLISYRKPVTAFQEIQHQLL